MRPINQIAKVTKSEPMCRQLETRFREAIASGRYLPGTKLPSNNALALQTGTSIFTVQTALTPLMREGLLQRRPRLGTFVRARVGRLSRPAIYYARDLWQNAEVAFYRAVQQCLEEELTQHRAGWRVFVDPRPEGEQAAMPPELALALRRREVDALIAPLLSRQDGAWIRRLKVPAAVFSAEEMPNRASHDLIGMLRGAFAALAAAGCRSVGMITTVLSPAGHETVAGDDFENFHASFHTMARRAGLVTRPEWVRAPQHSPACLEHFGYESFFSLWKEPSHPDGLLVFPDVAARGVLTAALAHRVSIPGELKLALHVNDRLPFPCPVPTIQLVTDVRAAAQALVRLAEQQIAGEAPQPIQLAFTVRAGAPTMSGETKIQNGGDA